MKNKILLVVYILFGLMFINAGLNKFLQYMPVPEDLPEPMMKHMAALMAIGWLLPLIAVAEIAGGVLVMFNKTRALGAIIILPVFTGIVLTHITVAPSGLPMVAVLGIIEIWMIIENRKKYLPMIS